MNKKAYIRCMMKSFLIYVWFMTMIIVVAGQAIAEGVMETLVVSVLSLVLVVAAMSVSIAGMEFSKRVAEKD